MAAIEEGWQQQEIHLSAYQYLTEIEQNKRNIVGVNHGVMEELGEIPVMKTDATLGERQTERLKTLRATRNNDDVDRSLSEVRRAAVAEDNLFPHVIEAVRNRATLGEIMGVLKDEFGTYTAPSGF